MLSYQHIYHAGNFADVQKHAVLVALLRLLSQKPQSYSFLDTHAGRGVYDLTSAEAQKVGEFQGGILPFWQKRQEKSPLSVYLDVVAGFNPDGDLKFYPGSAAIAHRLMRATDHLALIERHPGEFAILQGCFKDAKNVKTEQKDGFECLISKVPLPARRGLVLVDPSYEIKTEYTSLPRQLRQAWKKWPQGQFMIWYPMLPAGLHRQLLTALRQTEIKNMLVSEIILEAPPPESFGLTGSGLILINPPFGFEGVLAEINGFVAKNLGKAESRVFWLDNQPIDPETGLLTYRPALL